MKIKVFFVLPTLFAGGAERVISFVSQNLNQDKFDVKLIVIGFKKDSKYNIDGIPVVFLNKGRVLNAFFPLVKLFMKEKPQIVVSSISHLNTMMGFTSLFFRKTKFVGRHSTISKVAQHYRTQKPKPFLRIFSKAFSYGTKSLDYIICQSMDMKNDFLESYNYNPDNIWVIYNPITKVNNKDLKREKLDDGVKKIITIGRFRKIKGQLRLLDILGKMKTPFEFTIIGEGEYKEKIFNKIKELDLEDKINHIPHTNNVYEHLAKHDVFLQGSYSEGFPNTLLESCVVGTPVIAFEAPGGTREIIEEGVNGFMVKNEEEFLNKLESKIEWDPKIVSNSVYQKFSKEKVMNSYEAFFLNIVKQ